MEMTIDKAIDIMEHYKEYGFVSQENGRNKAIDIMCKYQKIEKILAHYRENVRDKVTNENMEKILEVVEDGNDKKRGNA